MARIFLLFAIGWLGFFLTEGEAKLERKWATLIGGGKHEGGDGYLHSHSLTVTPSGEAVVVGSTQSKDDIAFVGDADSTLDGLVDGFVVKFSAGGKRIWGSYVGGNSFDQGLDGAVDAQGNVIVVGWTSSTQGIGAGGYEKIALQGESDHFVAKYSPDGGLLWRRYFGGSGYEGYEVAVAVSQWGDIFLLGVTESDDLAIGKDVDTTRGGQEDVYLAKLSQAGSVEWCTYFGGEGSDGYIGLFWGIYDTRIDLVLFEQGDPAQGVPYRGQVFICGDTTSQSGIAKANPYQYTFRDSLPGPSSGFLASFDILDGALQWSTYIGGEGPDQLGALALSPRGAIVFGGWTMSETMIDPEGELQDGRDGFIGKFTPSGFPVWMRYWGGDDGPGVNFVHMDAVQAVAVDRKGQIYAAGVTDSASMGFNPQWSYDLQYGFLTKNEDHRHPDAYLAKFDSNGNLLGSTYYGGDRAEHHLSVGLHRSFQGLNIYLSGTTNSSAEVMTTPGAWDVLSESREFFLTKFWENNLVFDNP